MPRVRAPHTPPPACRNLTWPPFPAAWQLQSTRKRRPGHLLLWRGCPNVLARRVGTQVIPLCPALPSPAFTHILQLCGILKGPRGVTVLQTLAAASSPPLPTSPDPRGHHLPSVTFIPPLRHSPGICWPRSMSWPSTAPVTLGQRFMCLRWRLGCVFPEGRDDPLHLSSLRV